MKHSVKIFITINTILILLSSCQKRKEVRVIGFVYRGDTITLNITENMLFKIIPDNNEDSNRICFFNKTVKLNNENNDIQVKIFIDSNNVKMLDTLIIIPKSYREPFISFLYPSMETLYKRKIFIADEADRNFIKQ